MIDDRARLGLYMKNYDGKASMEGIFTKDRLTGMLEAADMKPIDMISPFAVALMDCVSGPVNTCPNTNMFTDYVEIMSVSCVISKR